MYILGINAYHGDSSACLVKNGQLIAAVEEERFCRKKHWAGFPKKAIVFCLQEAGIQITDIDHIAINRNPHANLHKKIGFILKKRPSLQAILLRAKNAKKINSISEDIYRSFAISPGSLKANIHNVDHHLAHLASAFFVSPFTEAACVSIDGFGDFVSTMWGIGENTHITIKDRIFFPHSLGQFYLAMTQLLGFKSYGDEYKVMGLAAYGTPKYLDTMHKVVQLKPKGRYTLNLSFFNHHSKGTAMTWDNDEPRIADSYSNKMEEILSAARKKDDEITQIHKDIAASTQAMYEEAFFHILNHVQNVTKSTNLALAGGCAMNSLANGKILEQTNFKKIYIQAASGDAGGAIGAAFHIHHEKLNQSRTSSMTHAYWGPHFEDGDIKRLVETNRGSLEKENCQVLHFSSRQDLIKTTAEAISEGNVIGWFQGKMEWGPRALGNRSILCDPRRADIREMLNLKIKRRESFRPFAPSILREAVPNWFATDHDVPFMSIVLKILPEKQKLIPAVTHLDGTGRLQTVTAEQSPLYYDLITEYEKITGIPILLNTSFNENEPIVCTPQEALDCFLRTKMDMLVLNNYSIRRNSSGPEIAGNKGTLR